MKLVPVLIAAAALSLSGCGGKEERLQAHLAKGRSLFADFEYDKAGVEVRNVLQIDPRSGDAYQLAAQIWERQNDPRKAFASYAKAVELSPNNLDAKAALGRYYLMGGALDKAEQTAAEVLAADPAHPGGRVLHAAIAARKGDEAGAIAEARAVLETHPGLADASALLASLLSRRSDPAEAAKVLAASVEANPRDIGLRLALAAMRERQKDWPGTEAELRRTVELAPRKFEYRAALAAFLARNGFADRAEIVLRDAVKAAPDEDRRIFTLADYLAAANGFGAAEKELRAQIALRPKAHDLRLRLANLLLDARRTEDAMQVFKDVIAADGSGPKGLEARGALARVLLSEGRAEEADPLIAAVLKENARDNTALLLRAQRSLQRGDNVPAIADLRAVWRDQPDSVELTSLLARAHLANKEPELARDTLARAVSLYPRQPAFRYLYASFLVNQGEQAAALREIDDFLRERPEDLQALQAKAEIQAGAKEFSGAEVTLKQVVKLAPESPLGYFRLAQLYVRQKKLSEAQAELEVATAKAPRDVEVLGALVKLLLVERKQVEATARLRKAVAAQPDQPLMRVMLGELLSAGHKLTDAAPEFRRALEIEPRLEPARTNLARLLLAQGDSQGAMAELRKGLALSPHSVLLGLTLAELYQEGGDNREAMAQYEAVLAYAPGSDVAANNFAALAADSTLDRKVLEHALEVARRFEHSPNPLFQDTLGWLHYRLGNPADAVRVLAKAGAASDAPVIQYHLGMALRQDGKPDIAREHLRKAAEAHADFPGRDEARALVAKG